MWQVFLTRGLQLENAAKASSLQYLMENISLSRFLLRIYNRISIALFLGNLYLLARGGIPG
jgi:putative ubiquitin-RnfH superfamily antitoxin RatB of RatAB toxin-antitoxin module